MPSLPLLPPGIWNLPGKPACRAESSITKDEPGLLPEQDRDCTPPLEMDLVGWSHWLPSGDQVQQDGRKGKGKDWEGRERGSVEGRNAVKIYCP